jgi:alkylation response protein AidB-like acyl-CoA dehydrogenase
VAGPRLRSLLGATLPPPALAPGEAEVLAGLDEVIASTRADLAGPNDEAGRYPSASMRALRTTGILKMGVPAAHGGPGMGHAASLEAQVRLGAVDSAVAQVFKVHDELVREIFQYCPDDLAPVLAKAVLADDAVIGLAAAEDGRTVAAPMTTTAVPQGDGSFVIDGAKIYTTGAAEADYIAVWAFDPVTGAEEGTPGLQLNLVPSTAPGVTVHRDWDNLGQRATDSGRVTFAGVRTDPALRASQPDRPPGVDRPLRYQAGFAAILVGLGIAALTDATEFLAHKARPWPSAGVDRASDDPLVKRLAGELTADLAAAYAMVGQTAQLLDAFARGETTRTELAVPIFAAKSVASRAALRATSEVFTLLGTRSTRRSEHFDRYWRNARTLTLHDPVEWKHLEIGDHLLNGWDPPFGVYT